MGQISRDAGVHNPSRTSGHPRGSDKAQYVNQTGVQSNFGEERRLNRAYVQRGRGRLECPDAPATALPQSPLRGACRDDVSSGKPT